MKVAVSAYSFSQLVDSGKETQLSVIKIAKDMGFQAIEFTTLMPTDGLTKKEYAVKLKEEATAQDIEISGYSVGANFLLPRNGSVEEEIAAVKEEVEIASLMGAKFCRHDVGFEFSKDPTTIKRGFFGMVKQIGAAIAEVTEYAKSIGVHTLVENHGMLFEDPERIEGLINEVGNPNFGLLMDIGNFICGDLDALMCVEKLAPYADYAHVKDFHLRKFSDTDPGAGFGRTRADNYFRGSILGHGDIKVKQSLNVLKKNNYDGYVAIEFEGMESPLQALPICVSNLKRYLDELGIAY